MSAPQISTCNMFGLRRNPKHRGWPDAWLGTINFELKSATGSNIMTARDFCPNTINKWRKEYFLILWGKNNHKTFEVKEAYFAHPNWLEPFFVKQESILSIRLALLNEFVKNTKRYISPEERYHIGRMRKRVSSENSPPIPMKFVRQVCRPIPLKDTNLPEYLKTLVETYPLNSQEADWRESDGTFELKMEETYGQIHIPHKSRVTSV